MRTDGGNNILRFIKIISLLYYTHIIAIACIFFFLLYLRTNFQIVVIKNILITFVGVHVEEVGILGAHDVCTYVKNVKFFLQVYMRHICDIYVGIRIGTLHYNTRV